MIKKQLLVIALLSLPIAPIMASTDAAVREPIKTSNSEIDSEIDKKIFLARFNTIVDEQRTAKISYGLTAAATAALSIFIKSNLSCWLMLLSAGCSLKAAYHAYMYEKYKGYFICGDDFLWNQYLKHQEIEQQKN